MMLVSDVTVLMAFVAGILLFFTPCVLPLIPVYLGYTTCIAPVGQKWRGKITVLSHAVFVALGFSVVFVLLGASVGFTFAVVARASLLAKISGGLLIFFGLILMGLLRVPFFMREFRVPLPLARKASYVRSFLLGSSFALAWNPCAGPILGAVLTLSYDSATAAKGAFLLAVFSAGFSIPFLLSSLFIWQLKTLLSKIGRSTRVLEFIGGATLVALGIIVLLEKLDDINRLIPFSDFTWT